MKPVSKSYEFVRGDTFYISKYFEDKEGNILKLNPETDNINFTVRKDVESEALIEKTLTEMIVSEDGKYTIPINSADTEELDFGKYGYDIELVIGKDEINPFVRTVESGKITLLKYDYSRPTGGGDSGQQ